MAEILVIDDDPGYRSALKRFLQLEGHQVRTAQDGQEGVMIYRHKPVDLVILDLCMPRKGGLQVALDLRGEFPGAKIIAITGDPDALRQNLLDDATALGVNRALQKPFDGSQLLAAVREVLHGIDG